MARALTPRVPIMLYGLDMPFTAFQALTHGNFKIGYVTDRGTASFKFFDSPVYVACHGVVRGDDAKYDKYTFSVLPEEATFIRSVEMTVQDTFARLIQLAEPAVEFEKLEWKSITYENLLRLKLNKTVGLAQDGTVLDVTQHAEVLRNKTKVTMTVEIYGLYHTEKAKGVIARVHSYKLE